jgi:hypothetical protein
MPARSRHVRYVVWNHGSEQVKGFLLRAGRFVKQTQGRLRHDSSPWAQDVARIFIKNVEVEEITVMDKDGFLHSYYRDRK